MWDMYNEDEIRVTGLQPDKGAFKSRRAALASFVRGEEGWARHEDGFIVFHHEDCPWGEAEGAECDCSPHLIAQQQGGRNH